MPCVETSSWRRALVVASTVLVSGVSGWLAGCATQETPAGTPAGKGVQKESRDTGSRAAGGGILPAPASPRSMADARLQAAKRLVAANPDMTYTGKPPDILKAIPVLTIELNGDGSIRHIEVMRYPSQARETVDMAIKAVKRAAPFGDVSRLPKPWRFNETFLFNDQYKFKPMTLDQR
ncbi:hypothetical protein [Aquabacterium sp.]|uniref:hypothetical protein n=1 Tax=Aquabacterium sp. TaxID=1872578 RepID=UPI0035B26952